MTPANVPDSRYATPFSIETLQRAFDWMPDIHRCVMESAIQILLVLLGPILILGLDELRVKLFHGHALLGRRC